MRGRQQRLAHPMKPEPHQVVHRRQPHDLLERVLQGPLADPCGRAQVGHMHPLMHPRQCVVLGDPDDVAARLSGPVAARGLEIDGCAQRRQQRLEQLDLRRDSFLPSLVEDVGCPCSDVHQPPAPVVEGANHLGVHLQRLHAAGYWEVCLAPAGDEVPLDVLRADQEGDALVACLDHERALGCGLDGQHQAGEDGQPVHRAPSSRSERDERDQPLEDRRAGPHWGVRRVVDDGAGLEANDDPPDSKRHRLELHCVEIDQIDPFAGQGGVIDLDNRDCGLLDRQAFNRHGSRSAEIR